MNRNPLSTRESVMKKGTWSAEEDNKLIAYVTRYGCWNWRQIPRFAGLSRCGKSCRLRWMNYLSPSVKKGNYSIEEEETILKLHKSIGNKWSTIAAQLPGRTDNGIKNYWNTKLKKREPRQDLTSNATSSFSNPVDDSMHETNGTHDEQRQQLEKQTLFQNLDDIQTSSPLSSCELLSNLIVEETTASEFDDNFWADSVLSETEFYFSTDVYDGLENLSIPSENLLWGDSLFY